MKITRAQLLQITKEELLQVIDEIKFKFKPKKLSKHYKGTEMGSKEKPCEKPGGGSFDVGNHLFHPHDGRRKNPEEWECNTDVEDKLHNAVAHFIQANSPAKLEGRVGEFLIKYFKDKTSPHLPIHKYSKNTPLWRGSGRKFNEFGFDFLELVQWEQGVEHKKGMMRFPFNGKYTMRRSVSSFTDDFASAENFMSTNVDKPINFVYETPGNTETERGGFFVDLIGMYQLQNNPDYEMSFDGKTRFQDLSSYSWENEVLLVGNGNGDSVPIEYVYINTFHLSKHLRRLKLLKPKLAQKIRMSVAWSPEVIKRALFQLKRDYGYFERALAKLPQIKAYGGKTLDNMHRRIEGRIRFYADEADLFEYAGALDEYKKLMDGMTKLFKELNVLKTGGWGSGFDQSQKPSSNSFFGQK